MQFEKANLYHIYNQGNNKQKIFFNRDNYLFFLEKIHTHILPYADIIAWCLMPNHFHFMVFVNEVELVVEEDGSLIKIVGVAPSDTDDFNSIAPSDTDDINYTAPSDTNDFKKKKIKKRTINDSIGIMLRSYTQAINKQQNRTGKLIREKTKAECINCQNDISPSFIGNKANVAILEKQYPQVCFNYIHENPVKAGLVKNIVDYEFSSAKDYAGLRNGKLINKKLANEYVEII